MKQKTTIQVLTLVVVMTLLVILSFSFGEKYAYSRIPEISLKGSIKFTEEEQKEIIQKTHKHIKENSAEGIEYFLTVSREQGDWIVFNVYPINRDFDTALLYVHIVNGNPEFLGPATSFPGLEKTYPELFK